MGVSQFEPDLGSMCYAAHPAVWVVRPDGSLQKGISFNHYAFGAIGDWLYRYIAGIQPDETLPGFKHSVLAPHPGAGLEAASATHRSPYGEVSTSWKRSDADMTIDVRVPPNTTAALHLPGARTSEIEEGGDPLEQAEGVSDARDENGGVSLALGSGCYSFRYPRAAD